MTVFLERGDSRNRKEGFKLVNDHDKIQMYVEGMVISSAVKKAFCNNSTASTWLLGKFSTGEIKVYLATLFWCQCHNFNCVIRVLISARKRLPLLLLFFSLRELTLEAFWSNYKKTYHFASMFYFYYLHYTIKGLTLPY